MSEANASMLKPEQRTPVVVALIGAFGVIGAALTTNIDKIGLGPSRSKLNSEFQEKNNPNTKEVKTTIDAQNSTVQLGNNNSIVAATIKPGPPEPPIRVGMKYDDARSLLISNGWQPYVPTGADQLACGERDTCTLEGYEDREWGFAREKSMRRVFREREWYETIHCFGSGRGDCIHSFSDSHGRILAVKTGTGATAEMPTVTEFYYASASNPW